MMNQTNKIFGNLEQLMAQGRLSAAYGILENAITAYPALGRFSSDLEHLRSEYGYMKGYALRGLPDPQLGEQRRALVDRTRTLADAMRRELSMADAPTLYFNTLRYETAPSTETFGALSEEYRRIRRKLSLAALAENPGQAQINLTRRSEELERRLFNKLWTLYPLTSADEAIVRDLMDDKSLPPAFKLLMVSAIHIGGMELYDERRLMLLMDLYAADDAGDEVSVRALCALLVLLWLYRSRSMTGRVKTRFQALQDMPQWTADVRMVTMQYVKSRDTERITRKFNEEVMPRMMELRPEIEKLKDKPVDPEDIEENPEWAEMLERSGIGDRLRELQELQEDGADVMMATFSTLKTFPFFNDIANWFVPFDASHTQISASNVPEIGKLVEILENAPMLCDNDKYSIALSLSQIPPQQRELMLSQLRMQSEQLDAARIAGASMQPRSREEVAVNYVRNLYRFYKLFRRKGEFLDPFASGMNISAIPALREEFADVDILTVLAEFYFKRGYYADALEAFGRVGDLKDGVDVGLLQKMGYCEQQLGHVEEALTLYEQANLLDSADRWTLRRMAWCYKTLGQWQNALDCYRQLAQEQPDDSSLALSIGLCLVKLRRFDEALQYLLKAEFLASGNEKATRALAWCTLLAGDYDRCVKYTATLLASASPRPEDYLNAGHLSLLTGHPGEAVDHYVESIRAVGSDRFLTLLNDDIAKITAFASVSPDILAIVCDTAIDRARQ